MSPTNMGPYPHTFEALTTWKKIEGIRTGERVVLDGQSLDVANVVAVARYACSSVLDETEGTSDRIDNCAKFLELYLKEGYNVYGANTGFGGSADSRTNNFTKLQSSLLQLTQSGVLSPDQSTKSYQNEGSATSMPTSWTRATMLVRVNSLSRGHSAVRLSTVQSLLKLIKHHVNPIIPLRGSISASGDLMPLAYVAGTLEGSPDIMVNLGYGSNARTVPAAEALNSIKLPPTTLGPKEGLGILNGTAVSAAVASFASYDANQLIILSQLIVAMSCEALRGHVDNWHPFMAQIRPHAGQREAAANIKAFLRDSQLAVFKSDKFRDGLFQDRYALRTSSQWIGPQLEDLRLAAQQISVELNSTTDNPVIDVSSGEIMSGGNFQAVSITSASEKIRSSMQMLGKLLTSLCTELINPTLNNGLPPNLCADDPSLSFTMKGVDINVAAYMSELAYLANPVSSHVQSAEMHNQAVNSLAFITTRYTMEAIKIVKMISAAHLYVVCQALDLRVLHLEFLIKLRPVVEHITSNHFTGDNDELQTFPALPFLANAWASTSTLDLEGRTKQLVDTLSGKLTDVVDSNCANNSMQSLAQWKSAVQTEAFTTFTSLRDSFVKSPRTPRHLSGASATMYNFIREGLGVPFHQGAIEHPKAGQDNTLDGRDKKIVGSWVSIVFEALNDGRMDAVVMDIVEKFVMNSDGAAEGEGQLRAKL